MWQCMPVTAARAGLLQATRWHKQPPAAAYAPLRFFLHSLHSCPALERASAWDKLKLTVGGTAGVAGTGAQTAHSEGAGGAQLSAHLHARGEGTWRESGKWQARSHVRAFARPVRSCTSADDRPAHLQRRAVLVRTAAP